MTPHHRDFAHPADDVRNEALEIEPPDPSVPDSFYRCPHYSDASMDGKCICRDDGHAYVRNAVELSAGRCPDCGHEVSLIDLTVS